MIVRPPLHWFRMLFVWQGSVLHRILPQLALFFILSLIIVVIKNQFPDFLPDLTSIPFTLLGIALAVFLSFRNEVCYERFWEARNLWGSLLNDARSITRQITSLSQADKTQQQQFTYTVIAYIHALRLQLREENDDEKLKNLLSTDVFNRVAEARFKPALILQDLGQQLRQLKEEGQIEPILCHSIDQTLSRLTEVLGGCERIASTPVPFTYSVILHRTVYFYCFLLPLGLAGTLGNMMPLLVVFIAYTFLSLKALADELQDPFGNEPNDLALNAMSDNIEATLREMLGEKNITPATEPVNFFLR